MKHPSTTIPLLCASLLAAALPAMGVSLPVTEDAAFNPSKTTIAAAGGKGTTLPATSLSTVLLRFDLADLPASITAATLTSARLRVYLPTVAAPGELSVRVVTSPWTENGGAVPTIAPAGAPPITLQAVARKRFASVDITSVVRDWLSGATANNGLAIVSATARAALSAKEGPATGAPATLEIEGQPGASIVDKSITTNQIVDGSITNVLIAAGAVETSKLADGAVTGAKIATGAVDGTKLAAGAVGTANLANGAVTSGKIANGAVGEFQLADGAVTTNKLADSAVTTGKLADSAVTDAKIAPGVDGAKLADGSVTAAKLAAGVIPTLTLADGSVTTSKLANAAVTGAKIANQTVGINNLAAVTMVLTDQPGVSAASAGNLATLEPTQDNPVSVIQPPGGPVNTPTGQRTVNLVTTGRPVLMTLAGREADQLSYVGITSTGSNTGTISFTVDNTVVATYPFRVNEGTLILPPSAFSAITIPPAGTHKFETFFKVDNAALTITIQNLRLVAFEL